MSFHVRHGAWFSKPMLPLLLCMIAVLAGCQKPEVEPSGTTPDATTETQTTTEPVNESSSETPSETTVTDDQAAAEPPRTGLLRHAVFFGFKETATEDDINGVVQAFEALPEKVPEIIDFQWGTNNSPEGLDDGFTHCFLLTFADEAGRETYLPHPAHKAFGDVLRPHMAKVFVIDYWGDTEQPKIDKPLQHAVFFKFKDDADPEAVAKVEEAFAALPSKIDTIKAFEWGKNNSPEKHDEGFTHCFLVTFDSEEGRETYLPHKDHLAFVEVLQPVLDKVRVLDFWDGK
ncbi:Dabb family protein [Stieleria varia]|uniref:Stress responsive A/B Barrel Domain protein n=1 Tax=Stieleria varia TaxID=2528005 RepID=A0A5C6BBL0_9BACT|nr:Dabb family protein [Stieleria varia]TWU07914.1 Stress responsive A/B Barrel Domain protein [Stieleria varia]